LLYAGQSTGPEPDKTLCIAQTSLLYGAPPMWAVAILMLVYYVWTCYDTFRTPPNVITTYAMVIAPYLTLVFWSLATGVLAINNAEKVNRSRRFFYCSINYSPLSNAMSIFTAIICLVITILEIRIAIILCRNWRGLKEAGEPNSPSVQLILRIIFFGIYIFAGALFSLATMWDKSAIPDIYGATVGCAVMLIFGSQPEVWRTWCFWRKERPQRVINISREPSYMTLSRKFDLDEKIDMDDPDIAIPPPAYTKNTPAFIV